MNWLIPKDSRMTLYTNGTRVWKNKKGIYHRTNGPAIEWHNGDKSFYFNGHLHRFDGPAMEWVDGKKEWWLYGESYTEEEFRRMSKYVDKEM